jgi:molybdate transport system substrate-binding protein
MRPQLLACLVVLLVALVAGPRPAPAEQPPLVAAAADLKFALSELAERFAEQSGQRVELVFGSSGNFRRQIEQGAPFQLYFSADEDLVFQLAGLGLTEGDGDLYALGRLAYFVPKGSPLALDASLEDLRAALADGRLRRLAIANPEHAPYGLRAQEALTSLGLWEAIQPFLVFGENVSQAAQFATTGAAQAGIIAYALALAPELAARGSYVLLDNALHEPLRQRLVLLRDAGGVARDFRAFVLSPAGRAVLERY